MEYLKGFFICMMAGSTAMVIMAVVFRLINVILSPQETTVYRSVTIVDNGGMLVPYHGNVEEMSRN